MNLEDYRSIPMNINPLHGAQNSWNVGSRDLTVNTCGMTQQHTQQFCCPLFSDLISAILIQASPRQTQRIEIGHGKQTNKPTDNGQTNGTILLPFLLQHGD